MTNSNSYEIKNPQLPKGLQFSPELKRAFELSAQRNGVPLALAETIYSDVVKDRVTAHEAEQAHTAARMEEARGIVRDRFGPDMDKRMQSARDALQALGIDKEMFDVMEQFHSAPNLIERLAQMGERLASGKTQSPAQTTFSNQPGATKVDNKPAQSAQQLQRQLDELQSDPKFQERFFEPRHPLYQAAFDQRQNLIAQIAAAKAVERGDAVAPRSTGGPGGTEATQLREQLARLHADPKFMAEFRDPRHIRHAERVEERQVVLRKIAEAEASPTRGSTRSPEAIRREITELQHDPDFKRDMANDGPKRDTDPAYKNAAARHQGLVNDLAAAQQQQSTNTTRAAAAGDVSAPGQSDGGAS